MKLFSFGLRRKQKGNSFEWSTGPEGGSSEQVNELWWVFYCEYEFVGQIQKMSWNLSANNYYWREAFFCSWCSKGILGWVWENDKRGKLFSQNKFIILTRLALRPCDLISMQKYCRYHKLPLMLIGKTVTEIPCPCIIETRKKHQWIITCSKNGFTANLFPPFVSFLRKIICFSVHHLTRAQRNYVMEKLWQSFCHQNLHHFYSQWTKAYCKH